MHVELLLFYITKKNIWLYTSYCLDSWINDSWTNHTFWFSSLNRLCFVNSTDPIAMNNSVTLWSGLESQVNKLLNHKTQNLFTSLIHDITTIVIIKYYIKNKEKFFCQNHYEMVQYLNRTSWCSNIYFDVDYKFMEVELKIGIYGAVRN